MDFATALSGLTDKQRIYVEGRLRGLTKRAAARAAGAEADPDRGAEQYESHPQVIAALDKARALSAEQTGIDRKRISDMLEQAYHSATNAMEMVAAARELGRLHGVYAPTNVKVDHNHRLTDARSTDDLKRLSTAELMKIAEKRGGDFIDAEYTDMTRLRLTDGREKLAS